MKARYLQAEGVELSSAGTTATKAKLQDGISRAK